MYVCNAIDPIYNFKCPNRSLDFKSEDFTYFDYVFPFLFKIESKNLRDFFLSLHPVPTFTFSVHSAANEMYVGFGDANDSFVPNKNESVSTYKLYSMEISEFSPFIIHFE